MRRVFAALIFTACVPLAYHIRYQMIIAPLALACTGTLLSFRDRRKWLPTVALTIFSIVALYSTNHLLKSQLQSLPAAAGAEISQAMVSAHCALRCNAHLYSVDCSSPEGRRDVESPSCSDILLGFKPIGTPLQRFNSLLEMVSYLGPLKTAWWLAYAPIRYLGEVHKNWGLEIGRFEFLKDSAVEAYPDAAQYYSRFLQMDGAKPKPLFIFLSEILYFLHFKVFLFNILCALAVLANLYLLHHSQQVENVFLAFISLGTFLVFAYFNPHVPFRFLIQILVPCFLGLINELFASPDATSHEPALPSVAKG